MEGFINTDNGDDKKRVQKTHRIFVGKDLTLTVICRCPISIQVGVGPGQFQDEFNWKTPALKRGEVELAKPLFMW